MLRRIGLWIAFVACAFMCISCTKKAQNEAAKTSTDEAVPGKPAPASAVNEASAEAAYEVLPNIPDAGNIEGTISFQGTPPSNKPVAISQAFRDAHPDAFTFCDSKNVKQDQVQVLAGGVANVVVEIRGVSAGKGHLSSQVINVKNCRVSPRIALLPLGSRVIVSNADPFVYDSTLVDSAGTSSWTSSLKPETKESSPEFKQSTDLTLSSTTRPWMKSTIRVVNHPYFTVTDLAGSFRIENIPPGNYEVALWHEVFGSKSGSVEITPGGSAELNMVYGP